MIWVPIAALALAAWLLVVLFTLALCRAAAQAEELSKRPLVYDRPLAFVSGTAHRAGNVVDLRPLGEIRGHAALRARAPGSAL